MVPLSTHAPQSPLGAWMTIEHAKSPTRSAGIETETVVRIFHLLSSLSNPQSGCRPWLAGMHPNIWALFAQLVIARRSRVIVRSGGSVRLNEALECSRQGGYVLEAKLDQSRISRGACQACGGFAVPRTTSPLLVFFIY